MSMADAGRRGLLVLVVLLAAAPLLALAPREPAAVRVAGIGLLWWYPVVAAPLGALAAMLALWMRRRASAVPATALVVAAGPAVFAVVAARVFAGAPGAPLLVLAVAVAPLVAVVVDHVAPNDDSADHPAESIPRALAAALLLGGHLAIVADVLALLGLPFRAGALAAGGLVLALAPARWAAVVARVAPAAGVVSLIGALIALGVGLATSPWRAWAEVASRPALAFGEGSPAVGEGRRLAVATTLAFTEPHRLTALSAGTYRVAEADTRADDVPGGAPVREWRLDAGDSLLLRPGDRLALPAGVRVRFEPGKRVPGAPVSGVAWADPPERRSLPTVLDFAGLALTLAAGALALGGAGGGAASVAAGAALLVGLVLAAAGWGVYAVHAAPELLLGAGGLAALLQVAAAPGPAWRGLALLAGAGLLALFLGAAAALRLTLAADGVPARGRAGGALRQHGPWVVAAAGAVLAALGVADGWRLFLAGAGLAAATLAAPALTGAAHGDRRAGALVGGLAFVALALGGPHLPPGAQVLAAYPALVAAPLAALVSVVARWTAEPRG